MNGFGLRSHIPHECRVGSVIHAGRKRPLKVMYVKDEYTMFVRPMTGVETLVWRLRRRWARFRIRVAWLFGGVE